MKTIMKWGRPALVVVAVLVGYQLFLVLTSRRDAANVPLGPGFDYDLDAHGGNDPAMVIAAETVSIAIPLAVPSGIAVDARDRIYVAGDRAIVVFAPDGTGLARHEMDASPLCLDVGDDGLLYVGFMEHLAVLTREGKKIADWGNLGEKAAITSVAVVDGAVFVADAGNAVVYRYDASGKQLGRIGQKDPEREEPGFVVPSPYFDVAGGPDDTIWIVDPGRHELRNYTPDGRRRSSWKKASMTIEGFCGCCNPTHIAIREDGSFVTSEKGFVRVKLSNEIGDLQGVVAGSDAFDEGARGLDLAVDSKDRILVLDPGRRTVRVFELNGKED